MTRGLKNNNPGNIRHSSEKFQGETSGADKSFKTFGTMAYGYRAMFVILGTYLSQGKKTIVDIITKWAPPIENNTIAYIHTIEKLSGIDKGKVLTSKSGSDYIKIVAAMSQVENGQPAVMSDVEAGFKLQNKITE